MSTRCQVQVIQEGTGYESKLTLYHHTDGYPTGMLPLFVEAFDQFKDEGYKLGRAGKVASFLCAADPGIFEPEEGHDLHGDIEYYYRLYAMNAHHGSMAEKGRWEVEVWDTPMGEATLANPGKLLLSRTEVHEAAKKADQLEKGEDDE